MPRSKKSTTKAQNKATLNTRWLNNAMKSIGSASAATFKSIAPNLSSAGTGTMNAVKSASGVVKNASAKKVGKMLSENKYVQLAKNTVNQSIKDIKSGNLYNENRVGEKMMSSMGMDADDFDDFSDMFDDNEGEASVTFNYIDESDNEASTNASLMISDAITNSSEAQLKASKATIDALIGVSSASISQVQQGFSDVNEKLDTISSTLDALLRYHEENTTNYYEHAIAAFEKIGGAVENEFSGSSDNPLDVFANKNGGLNGEAYRKYVKKRIKKVVDESPAGPILSFLQDDTILEAMVADPVGGLTKGLIGNMIPRVVEGTLKEVDKTFAEFIPNMLVRMSSWENDAGSSKLKQAIGKIFGVNLKTNNSMNMGEVTKDAATFDNVTRNAIVEVLPKYARESTTYLRQIAMHVTKKSNEDLLSGAEIFDPRTNSYKKKDDLMKGFTDSLNDAIKSAFTSSEFGKVLESIGDKLGEEDKKKYEDTLQQFFTQITQSNKGMDVSQYNLNNEKAEIHNVLARVNKGRGKNILTEALRYMYSNNVGMASAALAQQNARRAWNEQIDDISQNFDRYNVLSLGIDSNTDFRKLIEKAQGNKAAEKLDKAEEEKRKKDEEEYQRENKPKRYRSNRKLVEAGIKDWMDSDQYEKDKDLRDHGKIAAKLFGEEGGENFRQMGNHAKNGMYSIMRGDSRSAMREFGAIFTDQLKNMWNGVNEHFFKPLGEKLFGKDENGNAQGLFSGTRDKLNDTYKEFIQKINGKSYKDSKGEIHNPKEGEESLVDKAVGIFKDVKESVVYKLFGDEEKRKENKEKGKGALTTFTESIKMGLKGWKEAIFGESKDEEDNIEKDKKKLKESFMKNLPDAIVGGAGGAMIGALSGGSLLGMVIGGPIAGAAMGFAGSFLMKSDKFKDYLFGPEIENPDGTKRRIGGLISEKTQNFFKDNKKSIIGGATLGALKSLVFPSSAGLLTGIVGGPIAGAAVGAGWSLLKKSDMFQKFLYGDEEAGKRGVIQAFKDVFKGKGSGKDGDDENKSAAMKALGMGAIGAGGFALGSAVIGKMGLMGALVTPGGPLGAAVIGAAVGIAASGNKFSKWLFGEKDEETGKRKGGMIQKFGNYMHVEILAPMKSKVLDIIEDAKTTLKYDILENIRLPFVALADTMKKKLKGAKEFIGDKISKISEKVVEKVIKPFGSLVDKMVVQPAKKVIGKAATITYNAAKLLVTAPFKLLGRATAFMRKKITKLFTGFGKLLFKGTTKLFGFTGALIKGIFSPFKKIGKGISNAFKNWRQKRKDKKANKGKTGFSTVLNNLRAKLTDDSILKEYYGSKVEKAKENAENRKKRAARSQLDHNRRMMSKALDYDAKYFTKENYEAAIDAAKEKGMKIKWRGNVEDLFEKDPAEERKNLLKQSTAQIAKDGANSPDIEIRQLSEAHTTNELLREIAKKYDISEERAKELYDEMSDQRKEDASKAGLEYDEETGELKPKEENTEEGKKKKSFKDAVKGQMQGYIDKIADAGGIKGYMKEKSSGIKDFFSIKKGFKNSWLGSKFGFTEDYIDLSNMSYEEIEDKLMNDGRARAKGGPVKKDEVYLVGDGGKDPNAAELFVPNENGKILSQQDGGIKVTLTNITKTALDFLKEAIGNPISKKKGRRKKSAEEVKEDKAETKEIVADTLTLWRNELDDDDLKVGSFKKQKEMKDALDEKEKQEEYKNAVTSTLADIRDKNVEHHNLWSMIFSKKGLITLGVTAVAGLLIKNLPTVINTIKGIASKLGWWNDENAGTDGKSTSDLIKDAASDLGEAGSALANGHVGEAASKFILDEGNYDANSGGRVSLLANAGRKVVKGGAKVVNTVKAGVGKVKNGINGAKNLYAKLTGKGVAKAGETATKTATKEVAEDSLQMWARELAENAGESAVKNVSKESAEAVVEKSTKKGASKILSLVDDAISKIVEKIAKKCPNVGKSKILGSLKGVMAKMSKTVTEKFGKISGKIATLTTSKTATHAATLGLDVVVFCTVGAINGVSGTAKLFQVDEDHVDGWMCIISGAFGAIVAGTIVGSIIDVISGLIAEVCGFDLLNTMACLIYGVIAGEENATELSDAQAEFQDRYESYKDEEIQKSYETQKAAGLIDSNVTLEQYQQGVEDGTYQASYKSFQDYNADQHQSIGYKIGNGVTKGWRSVKQFFGGKTSYTDENGQTYADNGDGTFTIYDANGNNLGNVSKDMIDTSTMTKDTKGGVGNVFKNAGNAIKTGFSKVGGAITGFVKGGIDVGKAITTGFSKIKANFDNPDMSIQDYFNANNNTLNEDNPLYGLVDGVLNISKYVMFPKLLIHGVMKRTASNIVGFVKGVGEKASKVITNFASEMKRIDEITWRGDLHALNEYTPSISDDNPIGGITKGVLIGSKFLSYPTALVYFAGNKAKEFISGVADKAIVSVKNTMSSVDDLKDISKSGDITGLNEFDPSVDESTPLSGVINVALKGMKFLMYPSTLVHFAGNKIGEFIAPTVDKATDLVSDAKTYVNKLLEYTDPDKSMDSYDSEVMGNGDSLPSKFISPIIRNVLKVYVGFKRVLNFVGDYIGDKIGNIKDFFVNLLNGAKDYANGEEIGGSGRGPKKLGGRGNAEPDMQNGFSYYSQEDPRWKDRSYISSTVNDGATMGDSGCGPTAMAMVASQAAQGKSISPTQMATMASATGFRDETGTNEKFISYAGDALGLSHMDVENPSGNFIAQSAASGNPVILNGVSNDAGAFTPEGHYVVAVGTDSNGNILVNDPRGKEYNTSYTPDQLARSTRKAWSFGGNGFRKGRKSRRKFGGRGVNGDWMSIVKSVKALIAAQKPLYNQKSYVTINYNGKNLKVRTDCSGYVGACLQLYGAIPEGTNVTSNSLLNNTAISYGFTYSGFPGWDQLQQGDIITRDGHVEIFDHNEGDKHYVYNNGSDYSIQKSEPTVTGHPQGYSVVWRPDNAGTGANVVSVNTSDYDTSTNTESSSNNFTDVISKIGGVFTKYASKALTGILTGKWNYDFSDDAETSASASGSSDSYSSGVISAANISGTDTKERLYKFLIQRGLTPAGAAGLLGNLEAESGVRTNNVQNTEEGRVGSDTEYTAKIDSGAYGIDDFATDSAGYGLAQWTSSDRKRALYQLAKSNGKSISDENVQFTHLYNELNGQYSDVLNTLQTTNDVRVASNKVLHDFESPKFQGADVEAKRASYAQGYYDMFANRVSERPEDTQSAIISTSKQASIDNLVLQNIQQVGAYGRGPKNKTTKMFGGRGLLDDVTISSDQDNRYQVSNASRTNNNNNQSISTETLENLLTTAIKVLQSIDTNTSKIEGLQTTQVKSDNYGGNLIVNNTANNQSVREEVQASKSSSGASTNAQLALKIARGGI